VLTLTFFKNKVKVASVCAFIIHPKFEPVIAIGHLVAQDSFVNAKFKLVFVGEYLSLHISCERS